MAIAFYQQEEKLYGQLLDSIVSEASTTSIRIQFYESDDKTTARTPNASTLLFTIDPQNNVKSNQTEFILATSHSTSNGITTLSTVTRGLQRDQTIDLTGSATRAFAWEPGTQVSVTTISYNNNFTKAVYAGTQETLGNNFRVGDGTASDIALIAHNDHTTKPKRYFDDSDGRWKETWGDDAPASGDIDGPPALTTAERDARTWPSNGPIISNTTTGEHQRRTGGTWVDLSSGGTFSNADTTTAGKVEVATQAETDAGTATGGTGASLLSTPDLIASSVQDQHWVYGTSATGNDTYTVTLAPPATAYTAGMRISVKVDTANTGACTINVNSLGAKSIKLVDGSDPSDGDIAANAIIDLEYDGTNFQLQTPSAKLSGGGAIIGQHYHDEVYNRFYAGRTNLRLTDLILTSPGSSSDVGQYEQITTAASNNSLANFHTDIVDKSGASLSVHDKNPRFYFTVDFNEATAQEGFIGFSTASFIGTTLEDSVMTNDHFGYIVQDGTLYISVADGSIQQKTDISAGITITDGLQLYATFDGTTATFYVNGTLKGTLSSNVPDGDLTDFSAGVVADATAAAKVFRAHKDSVLSFDAA